MPRRVREPIQVYLTEAERAGLDAAARDQGVSRSELLRRGIEAMRNRRDPTYDGALRDLVDAGLVTPARVAPGSPPASLPVARLDDLLAELDEDRGEL
jgi:hypothetical protein